MLRLGKRLRATRLVALTTMLAALGLPAGAASAACTGQPVAETDAAGDARDPLDRLSQDAPVADVVSWSAEWTPDGLAVSWTLDRLPAPSDIPLRVLLFGFSGPFEDGVEYVFAEPDGLGRWSFGAGAHAHTTHGTRRHASWNDRWRASTAASNEGSTISVLVPSSRLYTSDSWNYSTWMGIGASQSQATEENLIVQLRHGQATSPVAATAYRLSGVPQWVVTDQSPEARIFGDPMNGYRVDYARGSIGYAPELCRPDLEQPDPTVRSCEWSWTGSGDEWFAAPLDVFGHGEPEVEIRLSAAGPTGSIAGGGIVSPEGEADWFVHHLLQGEGAALAAPGAEPISLPLASPTDAGIGAYVGRLPRFPHEGAWWIVAMGSGTRTMRAKINVTGAGFHCGAAKTGNGVRYLPAAKFPGAAAASISPTGALLAAGSLGGTVTLRASHTLVAFFGGAASSLGGAARLWGIAPDGTESTSTVATPQCGCSWPHASLVRVGGPGTYEFGVEIAATSGWSDWNELGLFWADMNLV